MDEPKQQRFLQKKNQTVLFSIHRVAPLGLFFYRISVCWILRDIFYIYKLIVSDVCCIANGLFSSLVDTLPRLNLQITSPGCQSFLIVSYLMVRRSMWKLQQSNVSQHVSVYYKPVTCSMSAYSLLEEDCKGNHWDVIYKTNMDFRTLEPNNLIKSDLGKQWFSFSIWIFELINPWRELNITPQIFVCSSGFQTNPEYTVEIVVHLSTDYFLLIS